MGSGAILARAPLRGGRGVTDHITCRPQPAAPHRTIPPTPPCAQPVSPSERTTAAARRSPRARCSALRRATWADGQGGASMYSSSCARAAAAPLRRPRGAGLLDHGPELDSLSVAHQHAHNSADGAQGVVRRGDQPERLCNDRQGATALIRRGATPRTTQRTWSCSSRVDTLATYDTGA